MCLSKLHVPSGQVIGYTYSNGRISGITVNQVSLLSQVSYQPFGATTGWQWGNGTTTVRQYDTDGQLTYLSSAGTSTYSYYADGLIRSRADSVAVNPLLVAGSKTFSMASTSNRVMSASGLLTRSYSYDAAGNTLGDGSRSFTYNDAGRMATATSGGVTTSYVYSGLGERVKKSNTGLTRYFTYDEAGQLLGEYDDTGGLVQETVWLGDIPVATLRPDGLGGVDVYYVHTDHLNTPQRVTRPADDTIIWRWGSVPFGATAADEDPDGDTQTFTYNLRFPGQYYDQETGLHYNYFRTYDPGTGRYLESDPIGLEGGLNSYAYAAGNPMLFFDPLGLEVVGEWIQKPFPVVANPTISFGPGNARRPDSWWRIWENWGTYKAMEHRVSVETGFTWKVRCKDTEECSEDSWTVDGGWIDSMDVWVPVSTPAIPTPSGWPKVGGWLFLGRNTYDWLINPAMSTAMDRATQSANVFEMTNSATWICNNYPR